MMDVNAFEFIKIVHTIQDMPIVLVSEVDKSEHARNALDHGASDLICTPTIQELKLIWKYVQYRHLSLSDKNKSKEDENGDEKTISSKKDSSENISKNKRWRWTHELHEKFIYAVNQLGLDKASPKKIAEVMDVPNLSTKSVSSYLQKFRETVKEKGIVVDWIKINSKTASKHVLNKKFSVMRPSSSSQPILSTDQFPESESQGLIGKMLKSQSPGNPIVPEQSFPTFRLQNYAPIVPNGNNYVHAPCNPNLIGQSNVHISSSPQLAENSNFMAENPSYMDQGNTFTENGVNYVSIGQNTNYFGMVNHAQKFSPLMQQNYSSALNYTDNSFNQMARDQLNMGWKNESFAPVPGTNNFIPVRNAYSLLNQWSNNAARTGKNHSYINPNTTPVSNWLGNNTIQRINKVGMMLNSNDANQGLNCLNNFSGDSVRQNHNAIGVDYSTQVGGGFGMMQSERVGQNEYIGVPYQGHIFNDLNGNIIDQNHNAMGNNYMQNLQIGINKDMGLAYPGGSRLGAGIGNFVNGNPVGLENNSMVQGINAGNDGAGSSERCFNVDDFVSDLLDLDEDVDVEHEGMNN